MSCQEDILPEDEKLRRQIANLKGKVKRRLKKLDEVFDPLERQRIEIDIDLIKRELKALQMKQCYRDLHILGKVLSAKDDDLMAEADWSKAGKA